MAGRRVLGGAAAAGARPSKRVSHCVARLLGTARHRLLVCPLAVGALPVWRNCCGRTSAFGVSGCSGGMPTGRMACQPGWRPAGGRCERRQGGFPNTACPMRAVARRRRVTGCRRRATLRWDATQVEPVLGRRPSVGGSSLLVVPHELMGARGSRDAAGSGAPTTGPLAARQIGRHRGCSNGACNHFGGGYIVSSATAEAGCPPAGVPPGGRPAGGRCPTTGRPHDQGARCRGGIPAG